MSFQTFFRKKKNKKISRHTLKQLKSLFNIQYFFVSFEKKKQVVYSFIKLKRDVYENNSTRNIKLIVKKKKNSEIAFEK